MMGGFYVRNNVGIALQAFGMGVLFGVPTVYVLLFNGIYLGAVSGYVVAKVLTHDFLYDFEYALTVNSSMWVPAGPRHSFRNIGDTTAVLIGFMCLARPDVPIN